MIRCDEERKRKTTCGFVPQRSGGTAADTEGLAYSLTNTHTGFSLCARILKEVGTGKYPHLKDFHDLPFPLRTNVLHKAANTRTPTRSQHPL